MSNYKEEHGITIKESFEKFHTSNPNVYKAFEQQALMAINRGKKKLSSKQILGWIRWNLFMDVHDEHSTYKINDAYTAHYAREFAKNYPEYNDVFNYRELRAVA